MEFFGLSLLELAGRLVLGILIGFCIGMTGVGGGVLVLPALTILLRMNPVVAVGTASFYAFLTKVSATFHHIKLKISHCPAHIDRYIVAHHLAAKHHHGFRLSWINLARHNGTAGLVFRNFQLTDAAAGARG